MIRTSLRNKLVILLLAISVLPFASSVVFTYFYTRDSLKDQFVQENVNLLDLGKVYLESYMDELLDITLSVYSNPNLLSYLRSAGQRDYETFWTMRDELTQLLYANEHIRRVSIALLKENRNILVSKSQVGFTDISEEELADYAKADRSSNYFYIETVREANEKGAAAGNTFTILRSLTDVPSKATLAYFTLVVSPDQVAEIGEKLYMRGKENLSILTAEGEPVFSSSFGSEDPELIERVRDSGRESGTLEWNSEDFRGIVIYNRTAMSDGGWILMKSIPFENLFERGYEITQINIAFGIFGISLAVVAAVLFSFRITSPLRILVENIRRVEKGKMQVGFQSLGRDEIGVLGESFRKMVERLNRLIEREYKLEIENKTNQLKVLQSQINPHFLHNALQSIGSLALKNRGAQVYGLLTNLSKIMRYSMNTDEDKVPLIREVNIADAYLQLYKERYCDEFEYGIDVDGGLMNAVVPKMLLQPVIENYFKHGMEAGSGEIGMLRVEGRREGEQLVVRVIDNGRGIDPGRRDELYKRFLEEQSNGSKAETNIGLRSVYFRLRFYYGPQASLTLDNRPEGGMQVEIRLPAEFETEGGEG
ncbi:sensor histidine kinase [Cohnella massiliensis]|uniref:sensor histidine kinase n=1 Tax=Cohnella massiliensis TaxID=1816691 RepID=UPI001592F525|nr:histidine kinase [Cohnella massiliensis]